MANNNKKNPTHRLTSAARMSSSAAMVFDDYANREDHQPLLDRERQRAFAERLLEEWSPTEACKKESKRSRGPPAGSSQVMRLSDGEAASARGRRGGSVGKPRDLARYITTAEAAEYLGLSESYLNKARHFGTGPDYIRTATTNGWSCSPSPRSRA